MTNTNTIFLGLGTNLGNRKANLDHAISLIEERIGVLVIRSSIYETKAWGIEDQPDFYNLAIQIQSTLPPEKVLEEILQIELDMGRVRIQKWGERLIDIDILFYEDLILDTQNLKIPHPHIGERNFVLAPMAEIAPEFIHPISKISIQKMLENSPDPLEVTSISPY